MPLLSDPLGHPAGRVLRFPPRVPAGDTPRRKGIPVTTDTIKWDAHLRIRRFDADQTAYAVRKLGLAAPTEADFDRLRIRPHDGPCPEFGGVSGETELHPANLLTTAGAGRLVYLTVTGADTTHPLLSTTSARIGVGNGSGTAAATDTDLSAAAGSTNRWFNLLSGLTVSSNVMTLTSSFASGDGNFAWNEWGADTRSDTTTATASATVDAVLLNHKTSIAQGTKASGQTWSVTATITIS